MYDKVVILEIKEEYCLAMTEDGAVIRIVKKDGLQEGDKVFVLEEDRFQRTAAETARVVVPFAKNRKVKKSSLQKLTAVAAAVMVCIASLMIPQMTERAYAAVSFDGDKSVQVELDRDGKVIDAVSFDGTVSEEELKQLIGRNLSDLGEMAADLNEEDDELMVVAYAGLEDGGDSDDAPDGAAAGTSDGTPAATIKGDLDSILAGRETLYLEGDKDDVKAAEKAGKSLGMYMIEKAVGEDSLEELLDGVPLDHVVKFLKNHGDLIPTEKAKKILKAQEEKAKGSSDKEKPYYKDDDDDDGDDDDDDRITTPGKTDDSDDDDDDRLKPGDKDDDDDKDVPDADDDDEDESEEEDD